MGEPVPDPPIDYGTDCPWCTPARWPSNETPAKVYCLFSGITNCGVSSYPAPNGEIFAMDQLDGTPCQWRHNGTVWKPDWTPRRVAGPQSLLRLLDKDGFSFFNSLSLQCPPEGWTYTNQQAACILMYAGAGGIGQVWWNDKINDFIDDFGFTAGRSLFLELFRSTGVYDVYKFCDLYDRTNIRIKATRL